MLASLQEICDAFVKKAAAEPGKDPNDPEPNPAKRRDLPKQTDFVIKNARGKIFTYGSFRLGVFGPGSDIDTLIVAPKYVSRDRYFDLFPGLLLKMAPEGTITGLAVVTDAFVPIIKFEYSGISIDLIFSRVMQTQLPPDLDLRVNSLLRGLDDKELRSLNGTRVTDEILTLVPEQSTFKIALRAIKLWAQRRAIYANIMGFPGGVAWAMLVARVCQLYPKAAGSVIIHRFFKIIAQWRWPQPVLLKPIEDGPLPVPVWNPKVGLLDARAHLAVNVSTQVHRRDAMHLMPVITPAYPSMCSTYNITRSSMAIIQQELERAGEVAENIMSKQRPWSDLFVKHTFFTQDYRYYVSVVSASKTKEAGKQWSGRVESKVRMLVQKLEFSEEIELARPFNKSFERVHRCVDDDEVAAVQGGSPDHLLPMDAPPLPPPIKKPSDEDQAMKEEQASEENKAVKEEDANGENKVVKAEDASAENGTDATYPIDIYTSTHYIGIRLKPGEPT